MLVDDYEFNDQHFTSSLDMLINRFLFDYRNTVHCSTGFTPATVMLNKQPRTQFSLLKPPTIKENISNAQNNQVKNFRGSRNENFEEGEPVYIRDYSNPNKDQWMEAQVIKVLGSRSYLCLKQNGKHIKRHVDQIRYRYEDDNPNATTTSQALISNNLDDNEQNIVVTKLARNNILEDHRYQENVEDQLHVEDPLNLNRQNESNNRNIIINPNLRRSERTIKKPERYGT